MKSSQELKRLLERIDHRGYPAYKDTKGTYDFADYRLSIDHVQGDPFASPSKLSVFMSHQKAGYPSVCFDTDDKKTALEDYLVRQFYQELSRYSFKARGSGKSGLCSTSRPGPEILKRSACECQKEGITLRFEVGFPANGRTIQSRELIRILYDFLPRAVCSVLRYASRPAKEVASVIHLAEDQAFIRQELARRGLVCFVANGSVLPRESGISSRPMQDSKPFLSPPSLQTTLHLPHKGDLSGMGLPRGITLIVGGGYHGKSTLLKAIEAGVYNHIKGDGREYVITDQTALKLRAEDGRSVCNVDISLFIRDLPNRKATDCFSTEDASGSTSQAAAVMEGMEAKSRVFLIDEDTSATNFMVRDELMQQVIAREKEPITPLIERIRDLYEQAGVSTVMVAGSSGAYFYIADTVLQMDCYETLDITQKVRGICDTRAQKPTCHAPDFRLPKGGRRLEAANGHSHTARPHQDRQLKIKMYGKDSFSVGKSPLDLRFVEQLVDSEQTYTLALAVRYAIEHALFERYTVSQVVEQIQRELAQKGFAAMGGSYLSCGMALPREQELYACFNRLRWDRSS